MWAIRMGRTWMLFDTGDELRRYKHNPKHVKHVTSETYRWTGTRWRRA